MKTILDRLTKHQRKIIRDECTRCSQPAVEGKTRCETHLKLHVEQQRARRQKLKEAGKCTNCANKLTEEDKFFLCNNCNTKARLQAKNARLKNKRSRLKEREYYLKRKAAGICLGCPAKALENKTLCATCLEIQRQYGVKKRQFRRDNELCIRCGKQLQNKICIYCKSKHKKK